jgi:SPP1 family predicted phage head-tail adaptor
MIVRLKTPITINRSIETTNSKGKQDKSFEKYKDTKADTLLNSGNTQYNERYTDLIENRIFIIRYDPSVNKSCQILYNNKEYKIDFIEPIDSVIERGKFMKVIANMV